MKKFILGSLCTAVMAFSGSAMAANFVAGKDYTVVANPVKVEVPGKIEVLHQSRPDSTSWCQ